MPNTSQPYRFSDYLRAVFIAPLASIPAAILIDLLVIAPSNRIVLNSAGGLEKFIRWAPYLILLSLPTAYVSTAIFGAIGVVSANAARYRGSTLAGAVVGSICGALTGAGWIFFLTRELFKIQLLFTGFTGGVILPISILSGLVAGVAFVKVINRPRKILTGKAEGPGEPVSSQ